MLRYTPKTRPFKHQSKAAIRAVKQGNLAFLMEPGTGKTKAAIDAAAMQHLRGKVNTVVVICPLSAKAVWADELRKHLARQHRQNMKWRVVNYDKVSRRIQRGGRWVYPHVDRIERLNPDLIILDESHRCKRASSNRAQALWRVVKRLRVERGDGQPFVYLLTGTPNPKGYIDLFAQFRIMNDGIFGTAKSQFEDLYCQYGFGRRRFTIIQYRRVPEIKEKIRQHSFIISKDKALDLPPQLWQNVKVKLPSECVELYHTLAEEMIAEIEGGQIVATNAGVLRLRLLQITGGFNTAGTSFHSAKVDCLRDMLEDLYDSEEPCVIFARFLSEVDAIQATALDVGYPCGAITGRTKENIRTDLIHEFQSGTTPRCLVFQVDTGSLAITLTRAREVIFYSLPDSWDSYWQSCNRIHRIGQTSSVRYRHIVVPNTVDMSVLKALHRKSDMHRAIMQNPRGFFFGG